MYRIFLIIIAVFLFSSCGKNKYTTEPQLKFVEFKPNQTTATASILNAPVLVMEITDDEGDVGFIANKDTSRIFIKNMLNGRIDSTKYFPDFSVVSGKRLKVVAEINLKGNALSGRVNPPLTRPYTDTLHFEVYITDFAKHKSNVLYTSEPLIYTTD